MSRVKPTWAQFWVRIWLLVTAAFGAVLIYIIHRSVMRHAGSFRLVVRAGELLWLVGLVISAFRVWKFRCPGCGRTFFISGNRTNMFTRGCMNCGLPKGQPPPHPDDPFTAW